MERRGSTEQQIARFLQGTTSSSVCGNQNPRDATGECLRDKVDWLPVAIKLKYYVMRP